MKKTYIILGCVGLLVAGAFAQDRLFFHLTDRMTIGAGVDQVDNIHFTTDETSAVLTLNDTTATYPVANIEKLTFGEESTTITVAYDENGVAIVNPLAFEGVNIAVDGSDVIVTNICEKPVEFVLSGTTADGQFKVYSASDFGIKLNGVNITNGDGPAINLQSPVAAAITLVDGTENILSDAAQYTAVGEESMKATLHAEGNLAFEGNGKLTVVGLKKHGICSSGDIVFNGGEYLMSNVASDGIHSGTSLVVNGGKFNISTEGDAFDGDAGTLTINGGEITVGVTGISAKGIKADGDITFAGGTTNINCSGDIEIVDGDPSYCTAVKSKAAVNISGGSLTIVNSSAGGKGISADGDINITGGTINATTSGNGAKYTDATGATDSYSAACIKSDGNITILGGDITCESKGTAGKGISADLEMVIGDETNSPNITVKTSGAKFLVSGSGMNADYANPKLVKCEGNMTINNGHLVLTGTTDGGEGLESKSTFTMNGGTVEIGTVDDCINAANHVQINGGRIYGNASNNDCIDSNGTITIAGGLVLAAGANTPEESFDCDQNTFTITGGIVVAIGGATSSPTTSVCTQCSVIWGTSSLSGKAFHVEDAAGNTIINYIMPTKSLNQTTVLFTTPDIQKSTTYTISTGGTITGTDHFHGFYFDGTYTGGTTATTFTPSSMVTNIGNSSGGPGGGRPGRP